MKILISASSMVHINNFHKPYIEEFKKRGNETLILSSGEGADFNVPFRKSIFSLKNLVLLSKIRKILKKEKFDVVYLHTSLSAFLVRLAMKGMKNRPYVINTVHGYLFSKETSKFKRAIYLFCERLVKKQTDDIVTMNSEDYEIATKNKLCKNKVFSCNGMGVILPSLSEIQKTTSDKTRLVFVGEISKRKNQAFLVKALKNLPHCTLTLVGDGRERKAIETLAKKLNVFNQLTITGFTKNIYYYLMNSDIYVCASKIEGLPFNIMEAMHAGLPIVASDIKGNSDLLPDECLYKLNDEEAYVNAIAKARKQEFSLDRYKLERVLEENMKIYTEFMDLE